MLEVKNVTKTYPNGLGTKDMSFTIDKHGVYGVLGVNGAGKSTLFNIITGYLAASEGTVTINGYDICEDAAKAKSCIGYLPEIPPLYQDMTVLEYLTFVAELKKIPRTQRIDEVDEACITTGISDVAGRLIRNLSKGYKQRVGLAEAILGKPEIIILDEPTVGLDPAQIIEIRELISELGKDHTVILSSHILSEISAVCDYVYIISKGRLVASDTTENLLTKMTGGQEIEIVVDGDKDIASLFKKISDVEKVEELTETEPKTNHLLIYGKKDKDIRKKVFDVAVENKLTLLKLSSVTKSLEEVFIELTGDDESYDNEDENGGDEE